MRRKRKSLTPDAPPAPVASEILDEFVRHGPIAPEELEFLVDRTGAMGCPDLRQYLRPQEESDRPWR